ncbi:MAG: 3-hydroxyacyl-CoA dehydrogenase NAD-binding domain-containing protein [Chloroflexota bacterium]
MTDTVAPATIGVIGAGTMGAGIAQVALEAGWSVRLHDAAPGAAERGRERIEAGLRRRVEKRDHDPGWTRTRLAALDIADTLTAASDGADLVIEAIVEDLEAKQALFATLDALAPPATILATNTSALSVTAIAEAATRHPERVLGLHFFNPAPVLLLVEVVAGARTGPAALDRATSIAEAWGKTPVRSADHPGFIVNRVNRPFTIEALRMLEVGEARVAEIDAAIRAEGFPMGPFELMDLVGLDVNFAAATGVWEGLGRPDRFRPSPIQGWLVAQGRLGRKTGRGFYRYGQGHDPVPDPLPHDVAAPVRPERSLTPERIVRRIRTAIAEEAVMARDEGVATAADIDTALWLGAAHPEGPFAWLRRHDLQSGR